MWIETVIENSREIRCVGKTRGETGVNKREKLSICFMILAKSIRRALISESGVNSEAIALKVITLISIILLIK